MSAEVPLRGQDDRKPSRIGIRVLILKLRDQPDRFTTVVIGCLRAALDDRKHLAILVLVDTSTNGRDGKGQQRFRLVS